MLGLLRITNAAITPGTHPQIVKIKTIIKEPQPLSTTAKGGDKIDNKTLHTLIIMNFKNFYLQNKNKLK